MNGKSSLVNMHKLCFEFVFVKIGESKKGSQLYIFRYQKFDERGPCFWLDFLIANLWIKKLVACSFVFSFVWSWMSEAAGLQVWVFASCLFLWFGVLGCCLEFFGLKLVRCPYCWLWLEFKKLIWLFSCTYESWDCTEKHPWLSSNCWFHSCLLFTHVKH